MIRSYLKRIIREVLLEPREGPQILREGRYNGPNTAEEALSNTSPSHVVFQIANGFIVVSRSGVEMARPMNLPVFCKTGEEIAEAIVAGAVKERLNVGVMGGGGGAGVTVGAIPGAGAGAIAGFSKANKSY